MRSLIVVDVQNDFMPDGNLPVENGYDIIANINDVIDKFRMSEDIIVGTQDWHPSNHGSFACNHDGKKPFEKIELVGLEQILWPEHCVQGTEGAEFVGTLDSQSFQAIFRKGIHPKIDSYSGFFDNGHRRSTGLSDYLDRSDDELYITGIATDVCVKFTVLDALEEGFDVNVLTDCVAGVNENEEDSRNALKLMEREGANLITSTEIS